MGIAMPMYHAERGSLRARLRWAAAVLVTDGYHSCDHRIGQPRSSEDMFRLPSLGRHPSTRPPSRPMVHWAVADRGHEHGRF